MVWIHICHINGLDIVLLVPYGEYIIIPRVIDHPVAIRLIPHLQVWMITIIGTTLGIPDTVMGLTFVAAGVSIPDALSSIAVIKEGYGDMAVSNAVGSNVFDILICLGLPWLIQTTILDYGGHVNVISKGMWARFNILLLFECQI